jgi:FdhD protein
MLCQVEQVDVRSDTNAPAPKPLGVNFREYVAAWN